MSPEWVLAIVGIITCCVIGWQSWETRRSADAAKTIAISTLRPKLIIRGVALLPGRYVEIAGERKVEDDLVWQIECLIANIGGTTAHVTESNLTVALIEETNGRLPTFPPYDDSRNALGTFTIKPGEHKQVQVPLTPEKNTFRFRLMRTMREGGNLGSGGNMYCLGFLQYQDAAKIERRTAFCLHYDARTECFNRVGNPDYEYAD
jgi:hypothetical protein